jgi:hypothetical protein
MLGLSKILTRAFEAVNGNGKIDPYKDRYAQSVLEGSKPICLLYFPVERKEIEQLLQQVKEGKLLVIKEPLAEYTPEHPYTEYMFGQLGQKENMLRFKQLQEGKHPPSAEPGSRDTEKGRLLGYTEDDINTFLKWRQSHPKKIIDTLHDTFLYKALQKIDDKLRPTPLDFSPFQIEKTIDTLDIK